MVLTQEEEYLDDTPLSRVAPIGLIFWHNEILAMRYAREYSDLTHPDGSHADCCALLTKIISVLMDPLTKRLTKSTIAEVILTTDISDRTLRRLVRSKKDAADWANFWGKAWRDEKSKNRWDVTKTFELALWGFFKLADYMSGALAVA